MSEAVDRIGAGSFSADVLSWLLRRAEQASRLEPEHDLVLVRTQPVLDAAGPRLEHRGRTWRIARPGGELSLRRALYDGPTIALVPEDVDLPLDLSERAFRRQVLSVEAHDLVAAASGRYAARIRDDALARAILDAPEILQRSSGAWTLGPTQTVTEDEVKSVLLGATLGFERKLERYAPEQILEKWLVEGPPTSALDALLAGHLVRIFQTEGRWLAEAIRPEGLSRLVAAGALAGSPSGRRAAPTLDATPEPTDERAWRTLRSMVERAVRARADAGRLDDLCPAARAGLDDAEARFHRLRAEPKEAVRFPLLRASIETATAGWVRAAADGAPPDAVATEPLRRNLFADQYAAAIRMTEAASQLARFLSGPGAPEPPLEALEWMRNDGAWADLVARSLRHLLGHVSEDLAVPSRRLLERYVEARSATNRRFARELVASEPTIYGSRDRRAPLPVHQISKVILRPLLDQGQRVFLVVLDGCDMSTFFELFSTHGQPFGLGASGVGGGLGDDVQASNGLLTGISPLPTLTSHARRAIFAGELPKNPVLDGSEAAAANASADKQAFAKNPALGDHARRLLLKDEVGQDGAPVLAALDDPALDLVATVFNGVDDALASHEVTALGPWRWTSLGGGLQECLRHALERDFVVVVTADHGHTPFWSADRKVKAAGRGGGRWRPVDADVDGEVVLLPAGHLRAEPLQVLTDVGAYFGTQLRGFHGGAGLEEVAVPIGFLTSADVGAPPAVPAWWVEAALEAPSPNGTSRASSEVGAARLEASRPSPVAAKPAARTSSGLPEDVREALAGMPEALRILELIADKSPVGLGDLAKLARRPAFSVRGPLGQARRQLMKAGLPEPFEESERDGQPWYTWKRQES